MTRTAAGARIATGASHMKGLIWFARFEVLKLQGYLWSVAPPLREMRFNTF